MNYFINDYYNQNNSVLDYFFNNEYFKDSSQIKYNVKEEKKDKFLLEVELPGYDKDNLILEITKDRLSIKEKSNNNSNLLIAFKISSDIKVTNANIKNGLLKLELNKIIPEKDKPKLISIN